MVIGCLPQIKAPPSWIVKQLILVQLVVLVLNYKKFAHHRIQNAAVALIFQFGYNHNPCRDLSGKTWMKYEWAELGFIQDWPKPKKPQLGFSLVRLEFELFFYGLEI